MIRTLSHDAQHAHNTPMMDALLPRFCRLSRSSRSLRLIFPILSCLAFLCVGLGGEKAWGQLDDLGYCTAEYGLDIWPASSHDTFVWVVDSDFATAMSLDESRRLGDKKSRFEVTTTPQFQRMIDQSVQNWSRYSRAKIRRRVITGQCRYDDGITSGDFGCIEAKTDFANDINLRDSKCAGVPDRRPCNSNADCLQAAGESCDVLTLTPTTRTGSGYCTIDCSSDSDCLQNETCSRGRCSLLDITSGFRGPGVYFTETVNCYGANGACDILVCGNFFDSGDIAKGNFDTAISHELGHAFGLDHADSPFLDNKPFHKRCISAEDGCDGELMCNDVPNLHSLTARSNDAGGVREVYGSSLWPGSDDNFNKINMRRVFDSSFNAGPVLNFQTGVSPNHAQMKFSDANIYSAYPPRIDCVKGTKAVGAPDCVAVTTEINTVNNIPDQTIIHVWKLSGSTNSGTSAWSSISLAANINTKVYMSPDITINTDGTAAWVTYASKTELNDTFLAKVDLTQNNPNSSVVYRVAIAVNQTSLARSSLPPRVIFSSAWQQPLVFTEGSAISVEGSPPRLTFSFPRLNVTAVAPVVDANGNVVQKSITINDLTTIFNVTATEFDIDCRVEQNSLTFDRDACAIAYNYRPTVPELLESFPVLNGLESLDNVDRIKYLKFNLDSTVLLPGGIQKTVSQPTNNKWFTESGVNNINAVTSISLAPNNNGSEVFVVASKSILSGATTSNSVLIPYPDLAATNFGGASSSLGENGDVEACATAWVDVNGSDFFFNNLSMFGGYSVAWCQTCNGGTGRLEGLTWGNRDDGDNYCH